ncbi:organelle RRM domain-containing protein 6, chloroplastic-like [Aristolochia californica]|uniref:organelle RRM domain-containing protein 6, chloroplastic-like n=1 Tax=Aristolochia californica TaxID=171875 RepID=UPI0035E150B3
MIRTRYYPTGNSAPDSAGREMAALRAPSAALLPQSLSIADSRRAASPFLCRPFRSSSPKLASLSTSATPFINRLRFQVVACLPSSPESSTIIPTKLYVSGLSFRTTEESLRNAFQSFGQLVEVKLVMDRIANRPRGFAFLRYSTEEESKKAIEGMHGKFLDGRVIFVEPAKPRWELREKQAPGQY